VSLLAAVEDPLHDDDQQDEHGDDADEDVAGLVQPVRELAVAARGRGADGDVGERPQDACGGRPGEERPVAHRARAHGQRDQRVQHRQEPRHEDGDAAPAGEVVLGPDPVRLAEASTERARPDPRSEEPAEGEADALAHQGTQDEGDHERPELER
jgi:hypothetical protein